MSRSLARAFRPSGAKTFRWVTSLLGAILLAALTGLPGTAHAQINKSGAGGLAPPSNGSYLIPIIKNEKLDRKFGLDFDVNLYTGPDALYSDFAAGRTTHIFAALYNAANFYVRGMPVRLLFTVSTANHAFVSNKAAINAPKDLTGRTIAATTSSGFYGMAVLFLRQNGLDPRKNLNVIDAAPAAVQTQLLADRADAGLLSDPGLSSMLIRGFHLVGDMNGGIRGALGMGPDAPVWYLGAFAHKGWLDADPQRAIATLRMWQDAAAFYNQHADEADKMISAFGRIPPDALQESRRLGLTRFHVETAIAQKTNIDKLFAGFVDVGFLSRVPDAGIYYDWPGLK